MTINDMIDAGIELQGKIEIRQWDDELETYDKIIINNQSKTLHKSMLNMEVTYMYSIDGILVIEVKG